MKGWIKVNSYYSANKEEYLVNCANIVCVSSQEDGTIQIDLIDGENLAVQQSFEEVCDRIRMATIDYDCLDVDTKILEKLQ